MAHQPLSRMTTGWKGYVVALRGGRDFLQRITSQGVNVGTLIEVATPDDHDAEAGGIMIQVGSARVRIGRGMADKILVGDRVRTRDLQVGQTARVTGYVTSDRDYRHKLLRMGMVKQAEFTLVRVAPLGDPVVIELRGSHLTLRKAEADAIEIEVIATP